MISSPVTASSVRSSFMKMDAKQMQKRIEAQRRDSILDEFDVQDFVESLKIEHLLKLDDEDLEGALIGVDALDLFKAVEAVSHEISSVKLENHILHDFLKRTDQKLLIGLKRRRETAASGVSSLGTPSLLRSGVASNYPSHRASSRTSVGWQSVTTMSSRLSAKKSTVEFRLNYRTKTEMAEKCVTDLMRRIKETEDKGLKTLRNLTAHIEELNYTCAETEETTKCFEEHFLREPKDLLFLQNATEHEIELKLRTFINSWLRRGHALLATMRIDIGKLHTNYRQHQLDLMMKKDLSNHLTAVDYAQLLIRRDQLLADLEEKNYHFDDMKMLTAQTALALSQEKKILEDLENESKRITRKTADLMKTIENLKNLAKALENKNNRKSKLLAHLQEQIDLYEAPSVAEYMERRNEVAALEKEEKILQRQLNILNIKMKNALARNNRLSSNAIEENDIKAEDTESLS